MRSNSIGTLSLGPQQQMSNSHQHSVPHHQLSHLNTNAMGGPVHTGGQYQPGFSNILQ